MGWKIDYIRDIELVYVKCQGSITFSDFMKISNEAINVCLKNKARRFLLDHREADTQVTPGQIYEFPKVYESMKLKRGAKCCLLITEGYKNRENARFFETVCNNNGYAVKIFYDKKKALEWLAAD